MLDSRGALKKVIMMDFPELLPSLESHQMNAILEKLIAMQEKQFKSVGITILKGEDGYTPIKGKDYFTDKEVETIIRKAAILAKGEKGDRGEAGFKGERGFNGPQGEKGKDGPRGVDGRPGIDGKDGNLITPLEISAKLNTLEQKIEAKVIKGLPTISEFVKEVKSKKLLELRDIKGARLDMNDQRWHGGGITSVSHDSSLTGEGTTASPLSVVSAGFVGSQEKSSTTPNGVATTFSFTHTPKAIFWNGAFQTLTDDYTVSLLTITFTGSAGVPQTGDKIVNLYA